jgi:hypothetical protein
MALQLVVPLGPREVAFSYMSRLARRNGVSLADFAVDMGLPVTAVVQGKSDALERLAELGGLSDAALQAWTPVHATRKTYHFRGLELDRFAFRRRPIRACPDCLREGEVAAGVPGTGMIFRGDWLLRHVTICLHHRRPLVDLWNLRQLIPHFDSAEQISNLAPRLRSGTFDAPRRDVTAFDLWLEDRIVTGRRTVWLDGFELNAACLFCLFLGARIAADRPWDPRAPFGRSHAASYDLGFQAAAKGEAGLWQVFDTLLRQTAGRRPTPGLVFGKLYTGMAVVMKGPDTAGFRTLIWRYIAERMPWFASPVKARVMADGLIDPAHQTKMPPLM